MLTKSTLTLKIVLVRLFLLLLHVQKKHLGERKHEKFMEPGMYRICTASRFNVGSIISTYTCFFVMN